MSTHENPSRGAWASFVRLITMLSARNKGQVALSTVLALLVMGLQLSIPWVTGIVIDDIRDGHRDQLGFHAGLLVAAGFLRMLMWAARRIVAGTISSALEQDLRTRLLQHLANMSFRFFHGHQTGQLLARVTGDVTQVRFFLGYGLIYDRCTHLRWYQSASWCGSSKLKLALVVYAMMPLIVVLSFYYSRVSHPVLKEVQQKEADVTQAAEENIVGTRVVRAFGQEHPQIAKFRGLTDKVVDQEYRAARLKAWVLAVVQHDSRRRHRGCGSARRRVDSRWQSDARQFIAFYGYLEIKCLSAPCESWAASSAAPSARVPPANDCSSCSTKTDRCHARPRPLACVTPMQQKLCLRACRSAISTTSTVLTSIDLRSRREKPWHCWAQPVVARQRLRVWCHVFTTPTLAGFYSTVSMYAILTCGNYAFIKSAW